MYYNERMCVQIPLGIDDNLFKILNDKENLRIKHNLPTHQYSKFGIFVGSFTLEKGWNIMIEIINKRTDIYWILITKNEYENFNSTNSFVYKKINQELLVELLNCADFFILPSPSETQCLASIEANLCGIPSIMRNTGYFTNLSQEEKNLVGIETDNFTDNDINTIYNKINNKLLNPREIVKKYFSINTMINKWIDIINKNIL
jgi:glycosyltransferase involved in cell wall biosynthesis